MFSKKKLILNVFLTPNVKNNFEFGSGYTSDVGFRSKIIWKKPWINAYGHSLETNFSLSIVEQFIDISYKIPLLHNSLEQYYLIQGGWVNEEDIYDLRSKIMTLNIARYWNYSHYWQRAVNLHWYINHCTQNNDLFKIIKLICPGISINRIQKRGNIFPYWGNSHRYSINISSKCWKSDINLIVLQLQNIWIQKMFQKHRFLIRNDISWMKIDNLSSTVSLFRYFYMKDRIIRGYENKFMPTNDYLKYKKLITSTFEYQYNLINNWWSSIFLDAGEITNTIKWNNFKTGIGFGIRWQLPIGPLQLDIAVPLIHKINTNHKLLHFYIHLGPEL